MDNIQILLVDDHPMLREGLRTLIEGEPGMAVIGIAGTVEEAVSLVELRRPNLVITDLALPNRTGLELIKELRAAAPEVPVLVLSMHEELIYVERVLRAGGRGYIMKDTPPEQLLTAIHTVVAGKFYTSRAVSDHFLAGFSPTRKATGGISFPLERLTDREIQVFELIGQAKGSHRISAELGISPRTLDAHRTHILKKLGIKNSTELTSYAIRWFECGMATR